MGEEQPTGGRVNWIAWVAVLLAVIIAIAYGLGVFH
jgi:hypothetical protein